MKLRPSRAALAALLLAASLCGCVGEPSALPQAKGGGGTFRVILAGEPRTLDPNPVTDEMAMWIAPNLFNKLVTFDTDSRVLPDLAESWTVSDGGRTYTFRLRQGVHWHDGEPLTAGDVVWTLTSLAQEPSLVAEALRRIEKVEAPEPRTVVIRLQEPWAPFLPTIAALGTFILPRHRFAGASPHRWRPEDRPIGTGPFQFSEWVPGERITLVANPSFFRTGPYLDRVDYLVRKERAVAAVASGEADYASLRAAAGELPDPRQLQQIKVLTQPSDARYYCGFNLRRPPLDDPRVREALNRAIDRHDLVREALAGYGIPAFGFYTPAVTWAYNAEARVPGFDPQRAGALLDEAGLRPDARGIRAEWEIIAPDLSPSPDVVRVIAGQLRAVGISLRGVVLPLDRWLERTLESHDFDLALMAGNQGPDPENLNTRFGSAGASQFMGYSSPAFDAAVAAGARTADLAERAKAYFRAQEILSRDLPVAPLAELVRMAVARRNVRGLPQQEARGLVGRNDFSLVRLAR
ncbi:MAG TPA: ABC transporter substrate-binding protein [Thermoanaerobaculia bacterium]|nr:ABC transporter substrate-binding protein [Thermoanaerobaculia bacterium]